MPSEQYFCGEIKVYAIIPMSVCVFVLMKFFGGAYHPMNASGFLKESLYINVFDFVLYEYLGLLILFSKRKLHV